ncbi:MAG TPA: protein kinase [Polyangiaceae bacterium]|nr:protein kinase [Polyangiaceae bacterium]
MTDSDGGQTDGGSKEPEAETDALIGTIIGERYRVDEKLGVGGMGAVYRGEHVHMRKPVAIKVLHREMTAMAEVVRRFELEAIAAGRIDHPNVTVATDFGKLPDGSFFLVLEYVPGKSLTELIKKEAPLPVDRALFIARQVAGGLGAAHAAGIVHRDLKPDNIMLIERGGTKDFVKVLDFGIAKVSSEGGGGLTRIGAIFGTPAYMAPEQAAGQKVDHRADIYSLGLVVYEMLAGRPAFEAAEIVGLLTKQLTEPPPPLPESIEEDVRALVMKMLEKDPEKRLSSVAELVAIIDARLGAAALPVDSTVLGVSSPRAAPPGEPPSVPARSAPVDPTVPTRPAADGPMEPAKRALVLATKRLSALAARTAFGESIRVFGRDVPLWLAGIGAGAVIMAVVLGTTLTRAPARLPAVVARHVDGAAPAKDMSPVIASAAEGDHGAMAELAAISEKERTAEEWLALAKGHAALGQVRSSLQAFRRAVMLEKELAGDPAMLKVVRRAADDEQTERLALDLAADRLGETGADILFDVATSKAPPKSEGPQIAKSLLDKDEVRAHASKALAVALALRERPRCEEAKRLLPRAIENADERSVRPLLAFTSRSGCGFLSLGDCYSCLRRGDDLADAIAAAKSRKPPKL